MYQLDENWTKEFKHRLKATHKEVFGTQEKFAEELNSRFNKDSTSRTKIANWESTNQQTLPSLISFFEICEVLGVDANYLAGATKYKNLENKDICTRLHINQETLYTLALNPKLGKFIDALVSTDTLSQIINRIDALSVESIISTAIQSNFKAPLIRKLEKLYAGYYFTTSPSEISEDTWFKYLISDNGFPNKDFFNLDRFIKEYFFDEGENNLHNSVDDYDALSPDEKYITTMQLVADFSYNYLSRDMAVEFAKRHLANNLLNVVNQIIAERVKSWP